MVEHDHDLLVKRAMSADQRPEATSSAFQFVALEDATDEAAEVSLRCRVSVSASLSRLVSPKEAVAHLEALLRQNQEETLAPFRSVALNGELPAVKPQSTPADFDEFLSRARRGEEGVAAGGTMLATRISLNDGNECLMVCQLGFGLLRAYRNPGVVLVTVDEASPYVERIAHRRSR